MKKQTMANLATFYERLPEIITPIEVVTEFQKHVRELIDYIIALEKAIEEGKQTKCMLLIVGWTFEE